MMPPAMDELHKFYLGGLAAGCVNAVLVWLFWHFVLHSEAWGYQAAAAVWIPVIIAVVWAFRRQAKRVKQNIQQINAEIREQVKVSEISGVAQPSANDDSKEK